MGETLMFVDANIFLEIALRDEHSLQCKTFIQNCLEKGKSLYMSDFVIYSCLLAIETRLGSLEKMKDFLISLHSLKITILRPSLKAMGESFQFMEKYKLDFDDALIIGCMHENDIQELVSYDKDFADVQEITVIRP